MKPTKLAFGLPQASRLTELVYQETYMRNLFLLHKLPSDFAYKFFLVWMWIKWE